MTKARVTEEPRDQETITRGSVVAARGVTPSPTITNPTLLFFELTNALRQRKSQTFHHSSARPATRVIRRAVGPPVIGGRFARKLGKVCLISL